MTGMLAILLPLLVPLAEGPPPAVKAYADCVRHGFDHPDEESATLDAAVDLAKAGCGNLRPAAVAAVRKRFASALKRMGDDPEVAAQAYLDILIEEPLASLWTERHG